jgi:hypothetical protein
MTSPKGPEKLKFSLPPVGNFSLGNEKKRKKILQVSVCGDFITVMHEEEDSYCGICRTQECGYEYSRI